MDEQLPSRRHSFTCLLNNTDADAGEVYYLDPGLPYMLAYDDPPMYHLTEDQQELGCYHRQLKHLVDINDWDSVPTSYYASPRSSMFSGAASLASQPPSKSDVVMAYNQSLQNGSRFENCEELAVAGSCVYADTTTEDDTTTIPKDQSCRRFSSFGKSSKKAYKKCALANGFLNSAKENKPVRVTHFNLKPTFIPAPTPRMSVCGAGSECGDHQHHLISTNDYVVTIEQLKLSRERAREKVRRIVVGVSVTLTLIAVVLVTAFLALGTKLEQRERNGNQQLSGRSSPFVDDSENIMNYGKKTESLSAPANLISPPSSSSSIGRRNTCTSSRSNWKSMTER